MRLHWQQMDYATWMKWLTAIGVASILSISALAWGNSTLDALELQLLGQKFTAEPLEQRITRFEEAFQLPPVAKASMQYRLSRIYALPKAQNDAVNRQEAVAAYNQGIDATQGGRIEAAIDAYKRAIQLNPGLVEAYNNLGNLFEHLNLYPKAIESYQRALSQMPDSPLLHRNLAVVFEKAGDTSQALHHYREYAKLDPAPDKTVLNIIRNYDDQARNASHAPDYYEQAQEGSHGKKLVWPEEINPIPVYISLEPDQGAFLPAIKEGLAKWEEASEGRLRFKEVSTPGEAKIRIALQEGPLSHPYLDVGRASYDYAEEGKNHELKGLRVDVVINTGERDVPIPLENRLAQVRRLTLHEIGHAIGIWGHSSNPGDVMYTRPIVSELSQRDRNTFFKLYGADQVSRRARR